MKEEGERADARRGERAESSEDSEEREEEEATGKRRGFGSGGRTEEVEGGIIPGFIAVTMAKKRRVKKRRQPAATTKGRVKEGKTKMKRSAEMMVLRERVPQRGPRLDAKIWR